MGSLLSYKSYELHLHMYFSSDILSNYKKTLQNYSRNHKKKNKNKKKTLVRHPAKLSNILARIIKFRLYKIILMREELSYEIIDTLVVSQAVFCYN